MGKKKLHIKMRPDGGNGWMYMPLTEGIDKHIIDEFRQSEPGEIWKIEIIEMTDEEYKELPEFVGW